MATISVLRTPPTPIHRLGSAVLSSVEYTVGVGSIPVVVVTGVFIGMVLAVQGYASFHHLGMETRIGSVINASLVKELGPVLAATMLAGRVGSSMAAELGTMRVTEQIDAIRALGANPVRQLVVPRFLACFLLIPVLTIVADTVGVGSIPVVVVTGVFIGMVLAVNSHFYWVHSRSFVTAFDVMTGLIKSVFFGGAIALVSCYHGFHCQAGAKGVGRAATVSFVVSFVAILALDFFLGLVLDTGYRMAYPAPTSLL